MTALIPRAPPNRFSAHVEPKITRAALAVLEDPDTRSCVTAERAVLAALEAGCSAPVGALAEIVEGEDGLERADRIGIAARIPVRDAQPVERLDVLSGHTFQQRDGTRTVGDLVELQTDRNERLKTGRMLCLLEACDLARPA